MPISKGNIGYGTTLSYSTNLVTPSYTALAELIDITPPKQKVKSVDFTTFSSPSDAQEFKPGLLDGGEVTLKVNYRSDSQAVVDTLVQTMVAWKTQLPITASEVTTGGSWTFTGFLTDIGGAVPVDDRITSDFTIKVSGVPVFTPGS